MADNDVEIRVSSVYDGKKGGIAARKDIDAVERAAQQLDTRLNRSLSTVGDNLDRVERKLVEPFEDAADKIPREFSDVEQKVERELDGIDASGAADKIEGAFDSIDISDVGSNITGQLGGVFSTGGPVLAIAGVAAAKFGDDFTAGINRGFRGNRSRLEQSIKTGLPTREIELAGQAAGEAYADNFGDGLASLKQTAATLQVELSKVDDDLDLGRVTKEATLLNDMFGIEIPSSVRTTRRLIAQDLVRDSSAALNLMADAAQRLPTEFEDVIDVANEFSPVFSRMGISGEQAFDFIIRTAQRGFFPTMDRAAELVQEFNIRLNEFDTLRGPVEQLGLDFGALQDQLARGEGAEALETIVAQILRVGDESDRNAIAVDFFGTSIEDVADKTGVLEQLLSTLNGELEVNEDALAAATAQAEKLNDTPLNNLQRSVEDLGASVGSTVNEIVGDFERLGGGVQASGEAAGEAEADYSSFMGIVRESLVIMDEFNSKNRQSERGLIDLSGPLDAAGLGYLAANEEVTGLTAALDTSDAEIRNQIGEMGALGGSAEELAGGYNELGEEIGLVTEEVRTLDQAFDEFFGISADERIASIHEQGDRLVEVMDELNESTFTASGSLNLASESGRAVFDEFNRMRGELQGATQDFQDGKITADEYRDAQATVAAQLAKVEEQGIFTAEQIAFLREEFFSLPDSVETDLRASNSNALLTIAEVQRRIDLIPRNVLVTVRGRRVNFGGFADSFGQTGGVRSGPTMVGEAGAEIVNLSNGSMIRSNDDSKRDIRNAGGGGGDGLHLNVTVLGSVISKRELIADIRDAARNGAFTGVGGLTQR